MKIDNSNQAVEQQFRFRKNEEQVKKTCSEIARHVRQRWDNAIEEERAFVQQLKTIEERVAVRLNGRRNRSAEAALLDSVIVAAEVAKKRPSRRRNIFDSCKYVIVYY